jgi:hypothetical protein
METQASPWGAPRRAYPSHSTGRAFVLTTSGETPTNTQRSLAPFIVTLIGFILAFGGTLVLRHGPSSTPVSTASASSSSDEGAVLFPPPPAIAGVSSATLLPPEGPPSPASASDPSTPASKAAHAKADWKRRGRHDSKGYRIASADPDDSSVTEAPPPRKTRKKRQAALNAE